ncbi:MAG TPA: YidC/Oxa1 family membrane protein insertase [Acidimicrobiales bacterium]|nr:YidC/Oxa1 family membrane protein insertase [Acidimicrobiales bacterium]
MLDPVFELISNTLNLFYTLVPDYAFAIAALTCVVMLITTPLTLKGTRSMIEMQRLQPQIRRLQAQYKDDRQKLNEEMMRFYKEHEINPVGGCLPLLIQAPVFSILFYVVRGLTNDAKFVGVQQVLQDYVPNTVVTRGFRPKYLDHSTELYQALLGDSHMKSFGVDLADSAAQALGRGFLTALPYILLVAVIAVLSWYQQKQIMGRNAGAEVTQQQQMMMRIGPLMYVFFAFISPAAIGIYFLISTLWRVGQQAFITRSLYRGEDSIGVQAQKAMREVREAKKAEGKQDRVTDRPAGARSNGAAKATRATKAGKGPVDAVSRGNGSNTKPRGTAAAKQPSGAGAGASAARPHPRSRKKKKRK